MSVTLPATGAVKFVCANRGGAGFYRVQYAPGDLLALGSHGAELLPVERMNLIADAWALFRAGAGPLDPLLDLLRLAGGDTDYAVLGEAVGRLDLLDRRAVTEASRAGFQRLVDQLLRPQYTEIGIERQATDTDPRRLQRAAVIRGLALVARAPDVVAELSRRYAQVLEGDASALDANLLDVASVAAARNGNEEFFAKLQRRVPLDPDPASKRRAMVALACFETPALRDRAIGLLLTDIVPMQDAAGYVSALLSNRTLQAQAWEFLKAEWKGVREKTAAPMLTRRLVEALGELVTKRADVERFFESEAATLSAAPAAVKQTRERLRLEEDVQRRATPALTEWLRRASQA
jgi:hypothetical protein